MVKIRQFKKADTKDVARLISHTYAKFNKTEGSKKAIQDYIDRVDPKKNDLKNLEENFLNSAFIYVAVYKNKIVGMVRGRKNRGTNLFVDGTYHKMGIGRQLMQKFETSVKKIGSKEIRIRASLYAVPFYTKVGYKKTTGVRTFHGLKIQPMKKLI
ncbi:GNAT family N-acetyltransferase [Candidatus Parcubacteria bacterium]|jgi:GNAT superfamily N-acetyltransferase|nr:GNAT family N-acetyltransferase [Candidatus Parcubacteria bacterium]MBT7228368.1 GNAT family N-acetyltransferase [Candidatus Parcubacteria bacterium]